MRKPAFCICENKDADQLRSYRAFVFAIRIVRSLYYLNPKFQVSSPLLWLYSPVCIGPGRKPRRPVFSQRGSFSPLQSKKSEQNSVAQGKVSPKNKKLYYSTLNGYSRLPARMKMIQPKIKAQRRSQHFFSIISIMVKRFIAHGQVT